MSQFDSLIIGEIALDTNVDYDGTVVKAIGGGSAVGLNTLGLVGGVLSAGFLCYLVGFFVFQTIGQEDTVKHARVASLIAGGGAAASINTMLHTSTAAFYNASLTFTSQNIGAKKPERVDKVLWTCLWMSMTVSAILGAGSVIFGRQLLSIYTNSPEVIEQGMIRMITTSGFILFNALNNMPAGALRGLGYTTMPLVITLTGTCFLRMAWVAWVFPLYPTPMGLYICYPLTWAATGIVMLGYYFMVRAKMYSKARAEQEQTA